MHDSIPDFLLPTDIGQIIEQHGALFPLNEAAKAFNISHSAIVAEMFIVCFLLLAIYFVQTKKNFASLFAQIVLLGKFQKNIEKHSNDNSFSFLLISVVSAVGIFMFYITLQNHCDSQNFYHSNHIDILHSFFVFSIILGLIIAYNLLLFFVLTNFFNIDKENLLLFSKVSFNVIHILGICLLFISFGVVYMSESWFIILIIISLVLIVLSFIALTVSYFRFFFNRVGTLFYFFLYLCTLEILPILVIKKLVLNFFY
jgi:hypothetical protein